MRHALVLIILICTTMLVACSGASEPSMPERDYDSFCNGDVTEVYGCMEYVKLVSGPVGSGAIWAPDSGGQFRCPILAPSELSNECRKILDNPPVCELKKKCFG